MVVLIEQKARYHHFFNMFWLYKKYQTAVVVIKCKVLQYSSVNSFFFTLSFNAMHVTSVARIFF